ncbi:MAG: energy-coupling factor transporter ATPase [Bacillati bacterium ANGP1]|uniref:Energy-coupling factor transporter ATPase n=1 Tax=Candidatus Segetimicrobium genomatis TaxID=2569760 RepID=A0A537JW67_9BACT|nr:MAG: energy-coupling factor transporter ATPase [Terrabacteria group bacterium ANGP1]
MVPPLITVRDLHHTYRSGTGSDTPALQGLDLDIYPGECLAIIGGNGSGKSTLAKHLNGLLVPTSGEVRVDGIDTRDPEAVWQVRQRVGMVFENPDNQIVAAVVEEDVAFGCENLGLPPAEIRDRVDRSLRAVGLESVRRHQPHQLSGGQKQRVAIAGVLAMRPRCLVLDEATSMLDPEGQREVLGTALRLSRQEGLALVLITHWMEEAAQADRVLVLAQGRIVLQGSPAEIFSRGSALARLHLEPPEAATLAGELAAAGLPVPPGVITIDQLVEILAPPP